MQLQSKARLLFEKTGKVSSVHGSSKVQVQLRHLRSTVDRGSPCWPLRLGGSQQPRSVWLTQQQTDRWSRIESPSREPHRRTHLVWFVWKTCTTEPRRNGNITQKHSAVVWKLWPLWHVETDCHSDRLGRWGFSEMITVLGWICEASCRTG